MTSRLVACVVTLLVVLTVNFFLPRLMPGDPLQALLDPDSSDYVFDDETRTALEAYYGLDRPLWQQYAMYLKGAVTGDLGRSIHLNVPVTELITSHLPWTLLLVGTALTLASALGLLMGSEAAWRRNCTVDRVLTTVSVAASNAPVYVIGMGLVIIFAANLGWLPMTGGRTPFADYESSWQRAADIGKHMILPTLTLTVTLLGRQFLLVRNAMVGVLGEDFMLVARAKGLKEPRIKWVHAVRNALLPFVAGLAAHAGRAITGSVFIETLFAYPGMGRLIFESVSARDYPVIQGVFLVMAVVVMTANLLADVVNERLDPRVREACAS
jgi:peptide/nickel transport system permease protein